MKRLFLLALTAAALLSTKAQESRTAFNFLRLPVSAHAAALGGDNISLREADPTLTFHNPALLDSLTSGMLSLNYMTYMEGAKTASASYQRQAGARGAWAVGGRYMDYGTMKQTDAYGDVLGDFSARDAALSGTFSYWLTDMVSGGITAKMVASYIGDYSSLAAAVDLGLNYYDEESGWSVAAVARNLGGQLSAYDDEFERMPLDLQVGATKRLLNSPFRFSATLVKLNDWEHKKLGKHLVVGADVLIGQQFYIAAGYNAMRASEMKITQDEGETSRGAGLSLGAGMSLSRMQLHLAWAKYHVAASSLLINFSYTL